VTAFRILAGLIQPLLALLLMAATPSVHYGQTDGDWTPLVHDMVAVLATDQDRAADHSSGYLSDPDGFSGGDGPDLVLLSSVEKPTFDGTQVIETAHVSYAPAFPSYRSCAAPPTGPPRA
jgi:hypothetical protein